MNDAGYFEQDELWGRAPEPYQVNVREDLVNLVSGRVESVLDVGCGDGIITNALPEKMRVVGVDTSAAALKHVRREVVHASATKLPFADRSFDLVMANDVMEHLDEEAMGEAVAEMRRVAKRWVVVTVPFMECLESGRTRCGACGTIYHVNHHQRAFGVQELRTLAAAFTPSLMIFSGAEVDPAEAVQRRMRAHFGVLNQWEMAVCPACGARASIGSPGPMAGAVDHVGAVAAPLLAARFADRSECIAVYSVGDEAMVSFPDEKRGLQLGRMEGVTFRAISARLAVEQNERVLEAGNSVDGGKPLYVWQHAGELELLYSRPRSLKAGWVVVPRWFDGIELPNLSARDARDEAEIERLLASGLLTVHQSAGVSGLRSQLTAAERAVGRMESLQVRVENLTAENSALLVHQGELERLKVELQNVRAENDALKLLSGRREQLETELQNLRAENDQLKLTQGRMNQLEVNLQNVRAENDTLKLAQGQMEQLKIDIQNLRAENDALKLRAKRCDELEVIVQNLQPTIGNGASSGEARRPQSTSGKGGA